MPKILWTQAIVVFAWKHTRNDTCKILNLVAKPNLKFQKFQIGEINGATSEAEPKTPTRENFAPPKPIQTSPRAIAFQKVKDVPIDRSSLISLMEYLCLELAGQGDASIHRCSDGRSTEKYQLVLDNQSVHGEVVDAAKRKEVRIICGESGQVEMEVRFGEKPVSLDALPTHLRKPTHGKHLFALVQAIFLTDRIRNCLGAWQADRFDYPPGLMDDGKIRSRKKGRGEQEYPVLGERGNDQDTAVYSIKCTGLATTQTDCCAPCLDLHQVLKKRQERTEELNHQKLAAMQERYEREDAVNLTDEEIEELDKMLDKLEYAHDQSDAARGGLNILVRSLKSIIRPENREKDARTKWTKPAIAMAMRYVRTIQDFHSGQDRLRARSKRSYHEMIKCGWRLPSESTLRRNQNVGMLPDGEPNIGLVEQFVQGAATDTNPARNYRRLHVRHLFTSSRDIHA